MAFLLVLLVIAVNTVYFIYRDKMPQMVESVQFKNGYYTFDSFKYVKPIGPVDKTRIELGDTLVSLNSIPIEKWMANSHEIRAGDTLIHRILRNNKVTVIPVFIDSILSYAPGFYWSIYILFILFSVGSIYLLFKKPHDKIVWLFFIYLQIVCVHVNAGYIGFKDPLSIFATSIWQCSTCLIGPVLINFHLLFP